LSETYNLIAVVKAKTEEALRKFNEFTKGVKAAKAELSAFEQAGRIAAGVLLRDMVQGLTASFTESLKLGGAIETLKASFEALSTAQGATDATLGELRKAVRGTVSDMDLLTAANTAMSFSIPYEEFVKYAEAAAVVGRAVGIGAAQAIDNFTVALGRLSPRILDNLGIQLSLEEANKIYAERLGVTVEALTEAQKATAYHTIATERLMEQAALLAGTTSEAQIAQEGFTASMKNLQAAVGSLFTPLSGITPILEGAMPFFAMFSAVLIPSLITQYGLLGAATTIWGGITAAASSLVTTSILGIPIIGWIAAAILAVKGLQMAWQNNWFGIRDTVDNVVIAISGKIDGLMEGVTAFAGGVSETLDWLGLMWAVVTGTVEGHLTQQKDSLTQSFEDQVQIIKDNMSVALDEVTLKYGEMFAAAEASHSKEIEEHAQFWIDQLDEQAEGFDKAVEEYQKHYDQILTDTESHYGDLLSDTKDHYSEILSETTQGYDDQLSETNTFYDEMLAEQSAFLVAIREGRSRDLDDLELNYLLQKQALKDALESQQMTTEEYEEALSSLEAAYRDSRADIRDTYRIQELQAEDEFRTEEERINAERAAALEKIEDEKADAITTVEEELKAEVERIEQEKADEVQRINEQRKMDLEAIQADKEALEVAHAAEMQRLENVKQSEIAGIQAQAELDMINAQKQLHADLEKAEEEHKEASTGIWGSLWAGLEKGVTGFATWLIGGSAYQDMLDDMEAAERTHSDTSTDIWSGLWADLETDANRTFENLKTTADDMGRNLSASSDDVKKWATDVVNAAKSAYTGVSKETEAILSEIEAKAKHVVSTDEKPENWAQIENALEKIAELDERIAKREAAGKGTRNLEALRDEWRTELGFYTAMTMEELEELKKLPGVTALQHGFEGMVTKPTAFLAGEAGPEYVSVTPKGQGGRQLVIHGPLVVIEGNADPKTAKMAADFIMQELRKIA